MPGDFQAGISTAFVTACSNQPMHGSRVFWRNLAFSACFEGPARGLAARFKSSFRCGRYLDGAIAWSPGKPRPESFCQNQQHWLSQDFGPPWSGCEWTL